MTTLQLKVAIAIKELGSISSAANKLELSQPNASSYIKSLENEIGFSIFNRTKSGATLTEKGSMFLEHAKIIISEHDSIMDIQNEDQNYRLRVGSANYSHAVNPFIRICEKHKDDKETDFCYLNYALNEGIKALDNYNIDILVAPALKSQLAGVKNYCKKHDFEIIKLCELPTAINVRKDHPAALDGRCINITQGSDVMKDFPYITYRNLSEDTGSTGYNDSNFIQSSYKIYVDGNDVRLKMVGSTNGFSFGILLPERVREKYNIVSFLVPNVYVELFCLIRDVDKNKREIKEYLEELKKELNLE